MVKEFSRKHLLKVMFRSFRNELSFLNQCIGGYQNDPESLYYHNFNAALIGVFSCFSSIFRLLFFAEDIGLISFQRKIFLDKYFESLRDGYLKRLSFF